MTNIKLIERINKNDLTVKVSDMRIGLVGCGNIGTFLLDTLNVEHAGNERIVAIYSRNYEKTTRIANKYGAKSYATIESFLEADIDLVVEVATIEVVQQFTLAILQHRLPLIVSSIGAFSNQQFLSEVKANSTQYNAHVYIPSGAVGGLDVLQSANVLNGIHSVQLVTRKPASSLRGAEHITKEKVIFSGMAKDAIELYPRNMNVAIAISLAGIGPKATNVQLIADPHINKNKHTIKAAGDFGSFTIEVKNEAMPQNPKTSYLAALSVLSSIKEQSRRIKIL